MVAAARGRGAVAAATLKDVRAAVAAVADPEMPPVTIGELGMIIDVRTCGGRIEVDLVATYSGCPATAVIGDDVVTAVRRLDPVADIAVRFVSSVVWDPSRITPEGRRKLADFGIAPPAAGPVLLQIGRSAAPPCPLCGSQDTVTDSPFGPTPCRSVSYCNACRNPFEAIKP